MFLSGRCSLFPYSPSTIIIVSPHAFILGYLVTTKITMSSTTTSLLSSSLSTTSEPTSKPSTTYRTSTTPSPLLAKCNDSGVVLQKSLMCVLPYYVTISMAKDKEAFCRQKLSISLIWNIFLKESRKLHIVTETHIVT